MMAVTSFDVFVGLVILAALIVIFLTVSDGTTDEALAGEQSGRRGNMSIKAAGIALCVALALPATAKAERLALIATGNEYMATCPMAHSAAENKRANLNELLQYTTCLIYAQGIADAITASRGWERDKAPACIPENVEASQLMDVGIAFIHNRPAQRNLPLATLLIAAFHDAWPCN